MKINFFSIIVCFSMLLFASCEKDEGEGGTSTIKGKLRIKTYDNSYQSVLAEGPAVDENVYLIYGGDNETYDDDFNTSYDGSFEFKYLQKGTYKIFAYTTDTTGVSVTGYVDENKPLIPVFATIEITDNKSTYTIPDLTIINNNNQGSSTIRGRVVKQIWESSFNLMYTSYLAPDEDVFIMADNPQVTYFDDTKTSYNGEYIFTELPPGDYKIYSFSTDTTGVDSLGSVNEMLPDAPVIIHVTVPDNGMEVQVTDTITILDY